MGEIFKLGEVVSISKGRKHLSVFEKPNGKTKRYIQIEDLRNDSNLKYTDENGVEVNPLDVIIAWDGANAGTIGFNLDGFIGSTLARLRIEKQNVNSTYLGWLLRGKFNYLRSNCTGATIPHISRDVLENIPVPIFSKQIQQKIASILEQADTARQKRKQANVLTEQFLQSAFIEMFGDPARNNKGWEVKRLEDVSNKITDGVHAKPTYVEKGVPFISVKDITTGQLIFDKCKFISKEAHESYIKRCKPEFGDILYTKVGATYGRPAIVDTKDEFSLYVSVALIKPKKEIITSLYLREYLRSDFAKWQADKAISGIGVPDLHLVEIKNFNIPIPPLALQRKFTSLVERVEKLRVKQRESEVELENLFQSLMQKYFGN